MPTRKAPTYLNMTAFTNRYNAPASTVYGYLRRGGLSGKKVGGRWQIDITPQGGLPSYFTKRQATGSGWSPSTVKYNKRVSDIQKQFGMKPWYAQKLPASPSNYKTRLSVARTQFGMKFGWGLGSFWNR